MELAAGEEELERRQRLLGQVRLLLHGRLANLLHVQELSQLSPADPGSPGSSREPDSPGGLREDQLLEELMAVVT